MKQLRIPSFMHEMFGEKQPPATIVAILLIGGLLTACLYVAFPQLADGLPLWRTALALLLIFDVFCGCIANFTASTNNYYAARPKNRIVFISIHVHIILAALLLHTPLWHALAIWAYTIAGAFAVNALHGKPQQPLIGGLLLAAGMGGMPMLPEIQPYMLIVGLLFMLKVLFSFAVDHYRGHRS